MSQNMVFEINDSEHFKSIVIFPSFGVMIFLCFLIPPKNTKKVITLK